MQGFLANTALAALAVLILSAPGSAGAGGFSRDKAELSDAEFAKLHREIRPDAKEAWRTIPWRISLLDAQKVAAREKKPLFIWAMDGHPLGCT